MENDISADRGLDYTVQLEIIHSGFAYDQNYCWVHSRAGAIPGDVPKVVLTMQKLYLDGSDVFGRLHDMRTDDLGNSWKGPWDHPSSFDMKDRADGLQIGVCDFTPAWHEKSRKLIGTGHTVAYVNGGQHPHAHNRQPAYSVYAPDSRTWMPWARIALPDELSHAGSGSAQRVDLDNGDMLLPIYYKDSDNPYYSSAVLLCRVDGEHLRYVMHGEGLTLQQGRGFYEPSLTKYNGQFLMTLRADDRGAVARSKDGFHFDAPVTWRWDDGEKVPTYNTQQHWVSNRQDLYLVYTRKAGHNDHVFRHRAPLFMAKVDPERLCLIRDSERVIIPEQGARLGNFGVTYVNEQETWVTVCEWMQNGGKWGKSMWRKLRETYSDEELEALTHTPHMSGAVAKYGANNRVYVARILWN